MSQPVGAFIGNPRWWTSLFSLNGLGISQQPGVAGRVFLTAIWIPRSMVLSRMTEETVVGGGAGTKFRVGLYQDNGQTPNGGALIVDSGAQDATAVNANTITFATTQYVQPGMIWAALETGDALIQFRRYNGLPSLNDLSGEFLTGCSFDRAGGYGALPATCPAVSGNLNANWTVHVRIDTIA